MLKTCPPSFLSHIFLQIFSENVTQFNPHNHLRNFGYFSACSMRNTFSQQRVRNSRERGISSQKRTISQLHNWFFKVAISLLTSIRFIELCMLLLCLAIINTIMRDGFSLLDQREFPAQSQKFRVSSRKILRKALARDFLGQARSFPFPTCLQIPTASYKQYEIINKQKETNSNNSEEVNSNLAI